ncbi:DUF192 domain-containing protein [Bellilinea sp.]|jgi:uncharacterized membrane protein (UPF0127 family)|uniref:DUF192 domain-containing protein n=1 Tax=Bellilinea sp. TaxID=2838785 RepID=UPI002ADDB3F7|nr:DUF192 domain-containing protein [Bellilinea sp.]
MTQWIEIQNLSRPEIPPIKARLCNSFWTKFRGLMFQKSLEEYQGILIDEQKDGIANTSIHMFFMRFAIAAIWINAKQEVVDAKIAHPWKPFYAPYKPARFVLETHPNRLLDFKPGDRVKLLHE